MLLEGKTVLLTGAARGIGRATAFVLAEEGARVAVVDRLADVQSTAAEIRKLGRDSMAAIIDLAKPEEIQSGIESLRTSFGEIDILVNNAGILDNVAPLARMTDEAWEREIGINLNAAFRLIRALAPRMAERKWGRIISISSIAAVTGLHSQAGYAASKAALIGLTLTVTLEYARHGVTCNAILPGLVGTEKVRQMPEALLDTALAAVPARRLLEPREIGYLVAFLASDRAAFVNGAAIPIDGGARLNVMPLGSRRELA
jgi:NAD(P)-dependent dehydrogenase (short-subunit alcohol dehydrogenase family)